MLTVRRKKQIAVAVAVAACAMLFWWWALSGYPTEEPICKSPPEDYDCTSHNIIFAFVVRSLDIFNYYGTAIATGVIAWFTIALTRVGRSADKNFRVTERAYVKISPYPPGIVWIEQTAMANAVISIRVKNFGRTPAHVTDVHVEEIILQSDDKLPPVPRYQLLDGRDVTSAFLVTEDEFMHHAIIGIPPTELQSIRAGTKEYYISGYVDYRDRFGGRHRGSFARFYDPNIDDKEQYPSEADWKRRINLTIVEQPLYNNDRPRIRGEGNDWD
jgi:hypothetical protein